MTLRELTQEQDIAFVTRVFEKCADYVILETGAPPNAETVQEFFDDHPSNVTKTDKLLLGISDSDGTAVGLVDIIRRYPDTADWYVGLFVIDASRRGTGLGKRAFDLVVAKAIAGGASRLMLCVLESNPDGHAFWTREGFVYRQTTPPWIAGTKTHTRFELIREL